MASYRIAVTTSAERQLRKLARADQIRVARAICALAHEPTPSGCRKLSGYDDVWRIRVGVYRILYSIDGKRLIVLVLKVGQRKDVYR